jgi:hypothetical protein
MASSELLILLRAIDKTNRAFSSAEKNTKKLGQTVSKQAASMSGGLDGASKSAKGFGTSISSFTTKAAAAIFAVTVAINAAKKAFEFSQQQARMTALEVTSANLAAGVGKGMGKITNAIVEASQETISNYDAMKSASQAMMLGIDADVSQYAQLTEIAALRGRAMGMSTTRAFSDIVRGIGRMSPLILDNLGIVIDAENRYKEYAASIGKATDELSSAEKKQALLNGVLEEGNALLEQAGGLAFTASSAYDRFGAKVSNVFRDVGKTVSDVFLTLFTSDKEYQQIMANRVKATIQMGDTSDKAYKQYVKSAISAADKTDEWSMALKNSVFQGKEAFATAGIIMSRMQFIVAVGEEAAAQYNENIRLLQEEKKTRKEASFENMYQAATMSGLTDAYEAYGEAVEEAMTLADAERVVALAEAELNYADAVSQVTLELLKMQDVAPEIRLAVAATLTGIDERTLGLNVALEKAQEIFAGTELQSLAYIYVSTLFQDENMSLEDIMTKIEKTFLLEPGTLAASFTVDTEDADIKLQEFAKEKREADIAVQLEASSKQKFIEDMDMLTATDVKLIRIVWSGGAPGTLPEETFDVTKGIPKTTPLSTGTTTYPPTALGGGIAAGATHLVGERGPELFTPSQSGRIIPNNQLSGGSNVSVTVVYSPTFSTASKSELEWNLKPIIQRTLRDM